MAKKTERGNRGGAGQSGAPGDGRTPPAAAGGRRRPPPATAAGSGEPNVTGLEALVAKLDRHEEELKQHEAAIRGVELASGATASAVKGLVSTDEQILHLLAQFVSKDEQILHLLAKFMTADERVLDLLERVWDVVTTLFEAQERLAQAAQEPSGQIFSPPAFGPTGGVIAVDPAGMDEAYRALEAVVRKLQRKRGDSEYT